MNNLAHTRTQEATELSIAVVFTQVTTSNLPTEQELENKEGEGEIDRELKGE